MITLAKAAGTDGYLILVEGEEYDVKRPMHFKGIDISNGGTIKTNGFQVDVTEYIFYPKKGKKGGVK